MSWRRSAAVSVDAELNVATVRERTVPDDAGEPACGVVP